MTRIAAVLVSALLLAPAARAEEAKKTPPAAVAAAEGKATIPVKGMHCGGCVGTVTEALEKVPGVKTVKVSLEKEQAVVTYDKAKVEAQALVKAIDATGYKAGKPSAN
jgi:copper ion binding protein